MFSLPGRGQQAEGIAFWHVFGAIQGRISELEFANLLVQLRRLALRGDPRLQRRGLQRVEHGGFADPAHVQQRKPAAHLHLNGVGAAQHALGDNLF